jgi:hypothetical protein
MTKPGKDEANTPNIVVSHACDRPAEPRGNPANTNDLSTGVSTPAGRRFSGGYAGTARLRAPAAKASRKRQRKMAQKL